MTTITVDAAELQAAAPTVAGMYATVAAVGHAVGRADLGALPAPLAARVQLELSDVSDELNQAADSIQGTAHELLQRAGMAKAADQLSTLSLALAGPSLTADLIDKAHELGKARYGVPDAVGNIASKAGYGLALTGIVLDFVLPTVHDLTNPYLDANRKTANALARGATTGVLVAGGIAVGLASPGLLAVGAAAGVGLTLSVIDKKLDVTGHIADGINAGLDAADRGRQQVADAVDKAGEVAGDVVGKAGDVAGDAAGKVGDTVGDAVGKVGNAAGDAVGKVGDTAGDVAGKVGDAAGDAVGKAGGVAKGVVHAFGL